MEDFFEPEVTADSMGYYLVSTGVISFYQYVELIQCALEEEKAELLKQYTKGSSI